MYNYFIRFSGEICIKWRHTRWKYINKLAKNIEEKLEDIIINIHVWFDKITLTTEKQCDEQLIKVFWIANFSVFEKYKLHTYENLLEKAYDFYKDKVDNYQTFCVNVNRKWNHTFKSVDLEKDLGQKLNKHSSVDIKNPEYQANLIIDQDTVFLMHYTTHWFWWFPVWAAGRTTMMLSWGIDSAVSTWMLYKMWMDVDFVFFDLGGKDEYLQSLEIADYLQKTRWNGTKGNYYYCDFKKLVEGIMYTEKKYRNLVLKYFFYIATSKIASFRKNLSIATWEALNQVSTQVIQNLNLLDRFSYKLVLRPLLCSTKHEIMQSAQNIWTYNLSYKGAENCSLVTQQAETKWNYKKVIQQVEKIPENLLEEAIGNTRKINIQEEILNLKYCNNTSENTSQRYIIYIKHSANDYMESAYNFYFEEKDKLLNLDKSQKYIVSCKHWKLSPVIKDFLEENWYDVIHR